MYLNSCLFYLYRVIDNVVYFYPPHLRGGGKALGMFCPIFDIEALLNIFRAYTALVKQYQTRFLDPTVGLLSLFFPPLA